MWGIDDDADAVAAVVLMDIKWKYSQQNYRPDEHWTYNSQNLKCILNIGVRRQHKVRDIVRIFFH